MDKEILCRIISDNLWSVYLTVAEKLNLPSYNDSQIIGVRSNPSPWPDFIFDTSLEERKEVQKLKVIDELIDQGILPPFWITDPFHSLLNHEELLRKYGFKLIMKWPGMIKKIDNYENLDRKELKIETLNSVNQIAIWFQFAEQNLFPGKNFDKKYYQLLEESSLKFIMIYYNNIPVGTTLVHIHNDTAGCFMVSILNEYRKKGIATWLMHNIINQLHAINIEYLVLQANEMSEGIYKKLGFLSVGDFEIYWKIGLI